MLSKRRNELEGKKRGLLQDQNYAIEDACKLTRCSAEHLTSYLSAMRSILNTIENSSTFYKTQMCHCIAEGKYAFLTRPQLRDIDKVFDEITRQLREVDEELAELSRIEAYVEKHKDRSGETNVS